ncbi:MAG: Flp pilus assembly complex ATPase component TadA [Nitrososphaerales archaeon]|nr:Flp pilus assembly complex ATPase component TadA [Nitrososphaerales archaeon]
MAKLSSSKGKKENPVNQELLFEPITPKSIPLGISVIERYPLNEPFAYVIITEDPAKRTLLYYIDELKLNEEEARVYNDIINILQIELKVPRQEVDPKEYFESHATKTIEKYKLSLGKLANVSWSKILYYAERDMVGYGPINPLMIDPNIEDISIDGVDKPVFVWHRKYESLESNLMFEKDQDLDDTITRLVHMAGKHISTAYPVVDATLPGRHRLAATFRREVSPQGSTVSIRKFREDPITIVDMMNFGTLDYGIAAYLWMLMENRSSTIVVGATASGKTTMLNSLLTMVRPNMKVVTIEEVQEINIPHQNWIPLVSRPSYGLSSDKIGEVSLYDLVKASLRMRPDVLVVGEVRGEEAFVLFQAISTGHGGMCLPPNEKLLVYEGSNPRFTSIEEVVEDAFKRGRVTHSFGVEIAEPTTSIRVPSFDENSGKVVLSNVKKVSKRYYNGNILKITTDAGKVINVTEDHPLLVLDQGRLIRVPAKQLEVGDLLPHPTLLRSLESGVKYVNLLKGLPCDQKGYTVKNVRDHLRSETKGKLAKKLGVKPEVIDWYRKGDYLPLEQYLKFHDDSPDKRYVRARKSFHLIPAVIPINGDVIKLLGYYASEGFSDGSVVTFSFNSKEARLVKDVKEILRRTFNLSARIVKDRRYQSVEVKVKDRVLGTFLTKMLKCGRTSKEKRVPDMVFSLDKRLIAKFLESYFKGDGCKYILKDKGLTRFSMSTSSEELLHGIIYLLMILGMHVNIHRDKRNGNYNISVQAGYNLELFAKQLNVQGIGSESIRLGMPTFSEKVPIEIVINSGGAKLLQIRQKEGNEYISRMVLSRLGVGYDAELYFLKARKIEATPYEGFVYDLYEVEGTHNFVHGMGLISSNCTLHADDVYSAMQRLTTRPMDVSPSYIPFLDLVVSTRRVAIPMSESGLLRVGRRVIAIDEVIEFDKYFRAFEWVPSSDSFVSHRLEESHKLKKLARDRGISVDEIMKEMEKRVLILGWLRKRGIRNYRDIGAIFEQYHNNPRETYEKIEKQIEFVSK